MRKIMLFATLAACSLCGAAEIRALDPKPQSEDPSHWWCRRFAEKRKAIEAGYRIWFSSIREKLPGILR